MVKKSTPQPEERPFIRMRNSFVYATNLIEFPFTLRRDSILRIEKQDAAKIRERYFRRIRLVINLCAAIVNQIYDFYLFTLLIQKQYYGFAFLFLTADLVPALPILYDRLRIEKSWKIFRFLLHPVNILFWICRSFKSKKHEVTLEAIKISHQSLEASFQIMLTITMMSMGILKWPGTYENSFKNAYNLSLNLRWWPVISTITSVAGILIGTIKTFEPIAEETGKFVGYLTFVPIFFFRIMVWQLIIITLERFALFLLGCMCAINIFALFICQRKKIKFDPVNYGLLSLVFPARPMPQPRPKVEDKKPSTNWRHSNSDEFLRTPVKQSNRNDQTQEFPISTLFCLVSTGNTFLLIVYSSIYIVYLLNYYNPWCQEDLSNMRFEEELFRKSPIFIGALYFAATLPTFIVYLSQKTSYCFLSEKFKKLIVGGTFLILFGASIGLLAKELLKVNYIENLRSTRINVTTEYNVMSGFGSTWSQWVSTTDGLERNRTCFDFTLKQTKSKIEDKDLEGSYWSHWDDPICSQRCGGGSRTKTRTCIQRQTIMSNWSDCVGQSTQLEFCNEKPCPNYTKLLVAGGGNSFNVEIVNLDSKNVVCNDLGTLPLDLAKAFGGLDYYERPFICGGETKRKALSDCFMFNGRYWTNDNSLNQQRQAAAATPIAMENIDFAVSGGLGFNNSHLESIEVHRVNEGWKIIETKIPSGLCHHCMLQFNSTTLLVAGGGCVKAITNETFFINLRGETAPGPPLLIARYKHTCAKIRTNNYGTMKSVIVVGGRNHRDKFESVEILDPYSNKWRYGPSLPDVNFAATLVEIPSGGVILVGGRGSTYEDIPTLWQLPNGGPDAKWFKMDQKLKVPRSYHVAFFVPDIITHCI